MSLPYQGYHVLPPIAITAVTQGSATGGLSGSYQYQVTFISIYGETLPSPATVATTITGTAILSGIPTGPVGIKSRNIYRTAASGTEFLLLTTLSNNTSTSYVDTTADTSLGTQQPPLITNADSMQSLLGYYQFVNPIMVSFATIGADSVAPGTVISSEYTTITGDAGGNVSLPPLNANLVGLLLKIKNDNTDAVTLNAASGNYIGADPTATHSLTAASYIYIIATSDTIWTVLPSII